MARARVDSLYALTASSAIVACAAVAAAASALTPPAVSIADRYLTLTAILVGAAVLTAIATARRPLDRPERLAAVVVVLTAAGAWYSARLWVHEKQFNYLVVWQTKELELGAIELSGDILNFLHGRAAVAPPHPAPATWDRDVAAALAFENETASLFEQRFGGAVRRTRDLFALEGITDRDFDVFYRHPANAFQIDVVARKLEALARRLRQYRSASLFGESGHTIDRSPFTVAPACMNIVAAFMKFAGKFSVGCDSLSSDAVSSGREHHLERLEVLFELIEPARADDRGCDARPVLHPRQGDRSGRRAVRLRNPNQLVDDREAALVGDSSLDPQPQSSPNVIAPRQNGLTRGPERPSVM